MEYLIEFLVFVGKTAVFVLAFLIVVSFIVSLALKNKQTDAKIKVESFNKKIKSFVKSIRNHTLDKKDLKKCAKEEKRVEDSSKKRAYVLSFDGDIKASAVDQLNDEISAILGFADKGEEVVLRLESQGGMVHSYGLAASQLLRIKSAGLKLTICIDKVAASGGYLMSCVGDKILAADFAIVGSIGVLAQVPNLNRFLKKHDVDYNEITAGEYKRTLSLFGEVTDKGKEKFTEQINETHTLFKNFVQENRPSLEIAKVATGEYWYGRQALELKLIDELSTSDDYLVGLTKDHDVLLISMKEKAKLMDKLSEAMQQSLERVIAKSLSAWNYTK